MSMNTRLFSVSFFNYKLVLEDGDINKRDNVMILGAT